MSTQLSLILEIKFSNRYSLNRHFLFLYFEIHKKKKKTHIQKLINRRQKLKIKS